MAKKNNSPYQKYGKQPYRYSEEYRRWKKAVLRGDDSAAKALGREHSAKFAPARR